ncbi:GFA family protein [Reyranella sp.]|uniref:GFA family protein n=1 Tax=Reyranella sp. TaxID=1929291 RepID=UPI003D128253
MNKEATGGCACGAIRYRCRDRPIVELICHCRDCQRASGGASAAVLLIASDRVIFEGADQAFHAVTTASGNRLSRGFCPACGSPVSARWEGDSIYSKLQALYAGSLDDPSTFSPTVEDWVSRAYPWHTFHPDTLKFGERPTPQAVRDRIVAYFAARQPSSG